MMWLHTFGISPIAASRVDTAKRKALSDGRTGVDIKQLETEEV